MEIVQYLNERFILRLPVVMLKPLSTILKEFFTDAFVIAWLFIFCCGIGYLIMYFVVKCKPDAVNTQVNNNTKANNNTLAIYRNQENGGTLALAAINNTQANDDTLAIKNTTETENHERREKTLNRGTQTFTYYKKWGKSITRRILLMEEIQVQQRH